jgi:hypothetical protein
VKIRTPIFLLAFALLSAWASAQNTSGPTTAADHLNLLKTNRKLLEELVEEGVQLGDANSPLERATQCQHVATRLTRELKNAIERDDADRVAEMSDYFSSVINSGFMPNFATAKENTPVESPDYPRLLAVHTEAAKNMDIVKLLIPADGKLAKNKRVQEARGKLEAAANAVGQPKKSD